MLEINKENVDQLQKVETMKDRIASNVESGVNFYLLASIIQALAVCGNDKIVELIKNIFANSIDVLKKDCDKIAGLPTEQDERIKETAKLFKIEQLIDSCASPYLSVLEQCCKIKNQ